MMQVLFQSPEEIVDRGIISLGCRPRRIPHRSGWFFLIHSAGQSALILVEKTLAEKNS
jgi:hypothetical protein